MQFFTYILPAIGFFFTLTQCTPRTLNSTGDLESSLNANATKRESTCHNLDYTDQTSLASPPVSDCTELARKFAEENHIWYVPQSGQRMMGKWGKCKLGFTGTSTTGGMRLGNEDLASWVQDSIDFFSADHGDGVPRVGAKGNVVCDDRTGYWGLY